MSSKSAQIYRVLQETPIESGPLAGHGFRLKHLTEPRYAGELERLSKSRPRSETATRAKVFAQFVLAERALLNLNIPVPADRVLDLPLVPLLPPADFLPAPEPVPLPAVPPPSLLQQALTIVQCLFQAVFIQVPRSLVAWFWAIAFVLSIQFFRRPLAGLQLLAQMIVYFPSLGICFLNALVDAVWGQPSDCPPCPNVNAYSATRGPTDPPPPLWDPTVLCVGLLGLLFGHRTGMGAPGP